ncbi:MAG: pyridoxamine kinase [Oscillospiraceae bacterium]|jgi:pyridoxine kinase|nr:pyridoxamine kinase [Oscillospiraceae bacterium]
MDTMPKVAAIHDMSGYGKCSLTVALPVLSVMGAQCCPVAAAYLSASTQYPGFTFCDMTSQMRPVLTHWKALGLTFDAIYSGFLGSEEQMDIVLYAKELFPSAMLVVDPVMGDNGQVYKTYTARMCENMTRLALGADVIVPNLTEAAIILGKPYSEAPADGQSALRWLDALSGGKRRVILTGLRFSEGNIGYGWQDSASRGTAQLPFYGHCYHGTGDIFASVAVGSLLQGDTLARAAERAALFVGKCAEVTFKAGDEPHGGVRFEELLKQL